MARLILSKINTLLQSYVNLTKVKPSSEKYAKPYTPRPTNKDYKKGYLIRYFCRQANDLDAPVTEIDRLQFKSWADETAGLDNGFYKVCKLKWKLTGPEEDYIENGMLYEKSVYNANKDMVLLKNLKLIGLVNKLVNFLQFSKK